MMANAPWARIIGALMKKLSKEYNGETLKGIVLTHEELYQAEWGEEVVITMQDDGSHIVSVLPRQEAFETITFLTEWLSEEKRCKSEDQ